MTVTVRYQAQLRQLAGVPNEAVSIEAGASVHQLLRSLVAQRPALVQLLLDEKHRTRSSLLLFVNDEQVDPDHRLSAGDEVILMTPIAGGA